MTTYIAGPMTGLPDFNYPAFDAVAKELRAKGVQVVCPSEFFDDDADHDPDFFLRGCLKALLDCDEIVLLPGWADSAGARLELHVAEALRMRVTGWIPSKAAS